MAHTLIAAQTDAVVVKAAFAVHRVPATLFAVGLAGAEECDIYISPDQGTTWTELDKDSAVVKLTHADSSFSIQSPMHLGVLKDATVAAAGVYLSDSIDT